MTESEGNDNGYAKELNNKKPPLEKRSFVSEEDARRMEGEETSSEAKRENVPSPEITLLYIANHVKNIEKMMAEYLEFFKKSVTGSAPTVLSSPPQTNVKPQTQESLQQEVPKPILESARIAEIKLKLGELSTMLSFDEGSSAQYVMVKPKQFLGSENFAKIAQIIKNDLGGQYVSAGKGSHFLVPKKVG